jgi:hypothetical protein
VCRFRDEFERYIGAPVEVTVPVRGKTYIPVAAESAGATA